MDDSLARDGYARISGRVDGERRWYDLEPDSRFFEYGSHGPGALQGPRRPQLDESAARYFTTANVLAGWDPTEKKYAIDDVVNSLDAENTIETAVGYQYWFADKALADGKTLKLSVVRPNSATHSPHVHAEDEFFFVLAGTAEFHLEGETRIGGPMTSFYCPSGLRHGIRNAGDIELKYLVIKKYIDK